MDNIIELWKKNNIEKAVMQFSCGGDSMGDSSWELYDNNNNQVACKELIDKLDREVYNQVNFYVNSDGHYEGEFGTVTVTLNNDSLKYLKLSKTNWSETINEIIKINLTDEQAKYVSENVENIGGDSDGTFGIDYKRDFIHTDEHEKIEAELDTIIGKATDKHKPKIEENGELSEWYSFSATSQELGILQLKLDGNLLSICVTNNYDIVRED